MFDCNDLVANHIYCEAPTALMNCDEFKFREEEEVVNQCQGYPDYATAWLVSDYLAEKLIAEGEFVVRLDDCNVWEFESSVTDFAEQLAYILEHEG